MYVGPSDLSLALGYRPSLDQEEPAVVDALRRIVAACKKYGVIAGLHNNTPQYALKMIQEGFQFVTIASESRFMAAKAAEEVALLRQGSVKAGTIPAY